MQPNTLAIYKQTVLFEGALIWVKPVCDFFNLNVQNQYRLIKKDPILAKLWTKISTDFSKNENLYAKNSTDLGKIDKNGRVLLSKKGFIRWIQIINSNTIIETLREKFISYQENVFDYLFDSAETELQAKIDYIRLRKLKNLYAKIGREIQRTEKGFQTYLDNKFVQFQIDFKNHKPLNK